MSSRPKLWRPTRFLTAGENEYDYSVVILNTPIRNIRNLVHICSNAKEIVAADGGANRVFDLDVSDSQRKIITPHAIVGDFDSIRSDVRRHYEAAGVPFHHDPDQYSTDFTKSLKHIRRTQQQQQQQQRDGSVIVFGGLGGRPDQAFAQLHQLYTAALKSDLVSGDLYLFTDEGVLFLLEEGENLIDTSTWPELITENVGIIPLGKAAFISTKGLEWDVQDWHTSFDTQALRNEAGSHSLNGGRAATGTWDRCPDGWLAMIESSSQCDVVGNWTIHGSQ